MNIGNPDVDGDHALDVPGEWVTIAAGTFVMGSPSTEIGRFLDEEPHEVTLTHAFEILATEVNRADFEALMGWDPSLAWCGPDCPVETVNWYEAAAYCNALSDLVGLAQCYDCTGSGTTVTCVPAAAFVAPYDCPGYRMPTEAEWEYAARAGTTTATYNGDLVTYGCPNPVVDPIAWTSCNSGGANHPAGSLAPNAWGLVDVFGNSWEWCHDLYEAYPLGPVVDPWGATIGSTRVFRGGSNYHGPRYARAAFRNPGDPGARSVDLSFRVARAFP